MAIPEVAVAILVVEVVVRQDGAVEVVEGGGRRTNHTREARRRAGEPGRDWATSCRRWAVSSVDWWRAEGAPVDLGAAVATPATLVATLATLMVAILVALLVATPAVAGWLQGFGFEDW